MVQAFQKMVASIETSFEIEDYDTWQRNRSGETTPPPSEEINRYSKLETPTNQTESKKEKEEEKKKKENKKEK